MNSIVIKNAIMNLINLKLPYKVMKYLAIYNEGHKHLISYASSHYELFRL